jgi:hypothetical protein
MYWRTRCLTPSPERMTDPRGQAISRKVTESQSQCSSPSLTASSNAKRLALSVPSATWWPWLSYQTALGPDLPTAPDSALVFAQAARMTRETRDTSLESHGQTSWACDRVLDFCN